VVGFPDLDVAGYVRLFMFLVRAVSPVSSYEQELRLVKVREDDPAYPKQPSEALLLGMIDTQIKDTLVVFHGAAVLHLLRKRRG